MRDKILSFTAAAAALGGSGLFFYSFTKWIPVLYFVSVALFALAAGLVAARFAEKKKLLRGLVTGGVYTAVYFGVTFLINNVIYKGNKAPIAAGIVCGLNFVFFLCFYLILSKGKKKLRPLAAAAFVLSVLLAVGTAAPGYLLPYYYKTFYKKVPAPITGGETDVKERPLLDAADFYVSPDGDDANGGSFEKPFKTIEKARDAVRALDKTGKTGVTVALKAGEYRVSTVVFTAEDSGTADCPITYAAYGDGAVVLNGGVTLHYNSFLSVNDPDVLDRLPADAKKNVLCADLFSLGITAKDYGKLYTIGSYSQAGKYDGDWTGPIYCELFIDDVRQTVARYPNGTEYLYSGEVVKEGQGRESADASMKEGYDELRNPEPDVYRLDKQLSERIKSWKTTDGVWMFGYPRYDWADCSSPIGEVDHENLTISPMFVSGYGAKKGAPFYFYNVLEEMDAPGEWYLDRDNGILYFYPPEDFSANSAVELSLSTDNIIKAEANCLTFDGLTVKGTRGDAVSITGDGNTVKNCLIKNVAGNALLVTGYDNLVLDNEITRTGKGGVTL
ncbi:MAG: hypothetical protein IJL26_04930, partial [Clostridia bacterium]|nr:hypothetical protein [Clostridia bacterium]